jgi:MSHA biogenesis protein MshM
MYYSHFGLKEPPFKITPNTEFFFNGSNRGAVLDALIYAITNGEGIVKVVGEVGSGKTMLCRMLQNMLPANVECIYLANPSVAPEDILHAIAFELALKLPRNADKLKVMQALQSYLLERHEQGKQVVIFVEEAQGMPLATLEEIRLLSNLETKHNKLLQMVLFGQPELDVNLNQTHIRQLRERITHSFYLTPLQAKEVGEYLIFRLRAAGYYGPHLFSDKAILKITKAAKGLIRRVNILADKALLAAFADNVYFVTPKHVNAAIKDSEFGAEKAKLAQRKVWWFTILGTALAVLLVLGSVTLIKTQPSVVANALTQLNWVKAKLGITAKTNKTNTKATKIEPKALPKKPLKVQDKNIVPIAKIEDVKTVSTVTLEKPTPQTLPMEEKLEKPVQVEGSKEVNQKTDMVVPQANQVTETVVSQNESENVDLPQEHDLLKTRLKFTQAWLHQSPNDTVTIQILGTSDDVGLKQQLENLARLVEMDNLYIYQTSVNNQTFNTVLYGSFLNRFEANQALKKLPASIQKNKPHLRTVGGILAETNKTL